MVFRFLSRLAPWKFGAAAAGLVIIVAMNAPADRAALLKDADLCVKCGLCLPHCPTYALHHHEADSPRGRITLIQGLASDTLQPSTLLQAHLDGCLSCRSCEAVCPAQVPFGRLMDNARAMLAPQRRLRSWKLRLGAAFLAIPSLRQLLVVCARLYMRLPVSRWLRALSGWQHTRLGRIETLLPATLRAPVPDQRLYTGLPRVQLFSGCTGAWLDAPALADTVKVLNRIGFAVDLPAGQQCCGALYQHAGLTAQAAALAQRNLAAFAGAEPILSLASGCGATLRDYAHLVAEGVPFSSRIQDICAFVAAHFPADLSLRPLPARVAVHVACTQKNVLRADQAMRELLQRIPGAELVPLADSVRCCGAAGSNMITDPSGAEALLQGKLDAARRLQPAFVVSGNIGCSLHLGAGLRRAGLRAEVLHPLSLLARCL